MKGLRLILSSTLLFLTSNIIFGEPQCPGSAALVRYFPILHSYIGVSTVINGSGPYEFMVDTGAQISVIDPALARELQLGPVGTFKIVTVTSRVEVALVSATLVEVGPLSARGIQMAVEDLGRIQADYRGLRGVLGTNFLSRFDLLIDNRHRLLCFDNSDRMQRALRGERVPTLSGAASSSGSPSAEAILVSVHLPDEGKHGSVLRLDSGSNIPLLYLDHGAKVLAPRQINPVHRSTIGKGAQFVCTYTPERNVRLGTQKEMQITFAVPAGNTHLYAKAGEDGVLPTTLFKRVFISVSGRFVIFDPH